MANLSTNEKQVLEKLFQMGGGYVLNFSNRTMWEFFKYDISVDIDDEKFKIETGSKANRMRCFWLIEENSLVGKSIIQLIGYIENQILIGNLKQNEFPQNLINEGKKIGNRLLGRRRESDNLLEDEFLKQEFQEISVESLRLKGPITNILQQRLNEIRACVSSAPLATIFLCGSTLEGILLGVAENNPQIFNAAKASPKFNGKVKKFREWTLHDMINVASETGFISKDTKDFGHSLRNFRNYIHPYEQVDQNFIPDEHTARICWQVLMAAISQLSSR